MNDSNEGFQYTPETGLQPGLPTHAAIVPAQKLGNTDEMYDAIIVGAGYAGLTAARDLTTSGLRVLLLEARDRIGGRTWSSNLGGYAFELGGTWVHWNQPHVYREISRYGLQGDLENSHDFSKGVNSFTLHTDDKQHKFSRAEEAQITESAFRKLVNVDGVFGRRTVPMPGADDLDKQLGEYDSMSIQDRLDQISLTDTELATIEGFLAITCGSKLEDASFGELLRWWALNNYDMQLFVEQCLTYKLRSGQSNFARKFFDEANSTGNLNYAFSSPVSALENGETVVVKTKDRTFKAKKLVCTITLNVLKDIHFEPPLHPTKVEASRRGHVNQVSKVHVEAANPEYRSLSSTVARPFDKLTYIFGDGTTPAGNTHLVSFGSSNKGVHLHGEENIDDTVRALKRFAPEMDVKRVVFHNWSRDPYAQGAWEWLRPGMIADRSILSSLRQKEGNVHFASADWAYLWRGFIDGAIEDGARVAYDVRRELLGW